jgi:hypothetical protein
MSDKGIMSSRPNNSDGMAQRGNYVCEDGFSLCVTMRRDQLTVCVWAREFDHIFWQDFGHSANFCADNEETR